MKQTLSTLLLILLFTTGVVAQKRKTIMGDMWIGVVESVNETTREITIVNPQKKTETFTGVLKDGYQVKLKDGTSRGLKMSELKRGLRLRVFYKSKTQDLAGKRTKVNLIDRLQFLGRDDYTQLREMLKLAPSIPVSKADTDTLSMNDPFRLYLALAPEKLDKGIAKWVDQWNKLESKKHGRVEIVDDLAQSDAALVVIWGTDDSYLTPFMMAWDGYDMHDVGFGTAYLVSKNDSELRLLSRSNVAIDVKEAQLAGASLGRFIEKRLKARSK